MHCTAFSGREANISTSRLAIVGDGERQRMKKKGVARVGGDDKLRKSSKLRGEWGSGGRYREHVLCICLCVVFFLPFFLVLSSSSVVFFMSAQWE